MFAGKRVGITWGLLLGIILDLLIGKKIGASGIMLGVIGFIGGYFDKNFSKESRITIIFMVIGTTAIFETGCYIINSMILSVPVDIYNFIKVLVIEVFYNSIIPMIQKYGYILENIYKNPQILTRYF